VLPGFAGSALTRCSGGGNSGQRDHIVTATPLPPGRARTGNRRGVEGQCRADDFDHRVDAAIAIPVDLDGLRRAVGGDPDFRNAG